MFTKKLWRLALASTVGFIGVKYGTPEVSRQISNYRHIIAAKYQYFFQRLPLPTVHAYSKHHCDRLEKETGLDLDFDNLPSEYKLLDFGAYTIVFDRMKLCPLFGIEHITKEKLNLSIVDLKKKMFWKADKRLAEHEAMGPNEFDGTCTPYTRGQLVCARNHADSHWDHLETFSMANMVVMDSNCNQKIWGDLEQHIRNIACLPSVKDVWVISGTLFIYNSSDLCLLQHGVHCCECMWSSPKSVGMAHKKVEVPTHFYKIVIVKNQWEEYHLCSYVVPNKNLECIEDPEWTYLRLNTFEPYLFPINTLVQFLGLDLFPNGFCAFKTVNPELEHNDYSIDCI